MVCQHCYSIKGYTTTKGTTQQNRSSRRDPDQNSIINAMTLYNRNGLGKKRLGVTLTTLLILVHNKYFNRIIY